MPGDSEMALDMEFIETPRPKSLHRAPVPPEFRGDPALFDMFAAWGKRLIELHTGYETAPMFPLVYHVTPGVPLSPYVKRMRLQDCGRRVYVNESLTLSGIPSRAHEYRLGNKNAIEWVIGEYRYTFDPQTNIVSDPNRAEDPWYIVQLVARVVTVSVETVKIQDEMRAVPVRFMGWQK